MTGRTHVALHGLGVQRGGRWLFQNLTLEVPRGRFVAVVGPSGVGKSSLLGCLAGSVPADTGTVRIVDPNGSAFEPSQCASRLGVVFQHNLLVPNETVLTNTLCGRLGRYPWWRTCLGFPRADRAEAWRILKDLGLESHVNRWVCQTSGGEQQRTAVARALLQQPDLYLADEPVSNLDVYLTGRVLGILRQEAHAHGRTVFCVLHNPDLVERFADLVLSLSPGDPSAWKMREVAR
ncbi:MAG: ATP-binding cassette domain-containing protein [Opitutaceae bacterium]|nr:ATP-binding cassette domain-containing protein [Opitutaceae bacterium]